MKKLKNKSWKDRHAQKKGLDKAYRQSIYGYEITPIGKPRYSVIEYDQPVKRYYQSAKDKKRLAHRVEKGKRKELVAPSNFSLYQNPIETLEYLEQVSDTVIDTPVHIRMEPINVLTIDTIMYFLAILKKLRLYGINFYCRGSLPDDQECRHLLQASGFLSYVNSSDKSADLTHESDVVRIVSGHSAEGQTVKSVCDFVISKLCYTRIETMKLYNMIMELMSNTKNHAYINQSLTILADWYIFVYYLPQKNAVRFIFLDTGAGIPTTVRKRLYEPAKELVRNLNPHTDYIKSALDGDFLRSRTGEAYRGNGLPTINSFYKEGYIKDLTIISNRGYFSEAKQDDLDSGLDGTLFYWELSRE